MDFDLAPPAAAGWRGGGQPMTSAGGYNEVAAEFGWDPAYDLTASDV